MHSAREHRSLKRGDHAYLLDRTGATPPATVRIELVTAVYVYWRILQSTRLEHRPGQQGRTFKHLNLVVPGAPAPATAPAPAPRPNQDGPAVIGARQARPADVANVAPGRSAAR